MLYFSSFSARRFSPAYGMDPIRYASWSPTPLMECWSPLRLHGHDRAISLLSNSQVSLRLPLRILAPCFAFERTQTQASHDFVRWMHLKTGIAAALSQGKLWLSTYLRLAPHEETGPERSSLRFACFRSFARSSRLVSSCVMRSSVALATAVASILTNRGVLPLGAHGANGMQTCVCVRDYTRVCSMECRRSSRCWRRPWGGRAACTPPGPTSTSTPSSAWSESTSRRRSSGLGRRSRATAASAEDEGGKTTTNDRSIDPSIDWLVWLFGLPALAIGRDVLCTMQVAARHGPAGVVVAWLCRPDGGGGGEEW